MAKECGWKCGDENEEHKHYSVLVRENGKLLGRLTPLGTANRLKIHAAVLSNAKATRIAGEINDAGEFTATVTPF